MASVQNISLPARDGETKVISPVQDAIINKKTVKFKCDRCVAELSTVGSLKIHQRSVHGGIKYQCDKCGKDFSTKGNMKDHQRSIHDGRKLSSLTTLTSHTKPKTTPSNKPVYPVFPDVSLKKLPFSKVEETILKPSSLQSLGKGKFQEQNFTFYLSKPQINSISDSRFKNDQGKLQYRHQLQMRFSLLDTSCDQLDNFPPSACVKVNGKLCPLPNSVPSNPAAQSKRPALPVNITPLCKLSSTASNTITVTWAVEVGRAHTVSVYQVENLTHKELLEQLKAKGQRQPDYTKALIKEKLSDQDQEIATTSCKITLACPLGKMRMNDPCRASTCDHLQCFDAQLYLMMNEKKPK